MGLIGEECKPCRKAAEDEDNHSLGARWWRGWAQANEKSGYIGAAIVGSFLAVVIGWYGIKFASNFLKNCNVLKCMYRA